MARRSSMREIKDKLFQCGICMGQIVNRKEMPCGHSFCMECFREKSERTNVDNAERCPRCKSYRRLPSDCGWKLHSPRGIALRPGQGYAVVENADGQITLFDKVDAGFATEGPGFKVNKKLANGTFSYPWDLTISPDGFYFVTDSTPSISVFNQGRKLERLLDIKSIISESSNCSEDEEIALRGIDMDKFGKIFVGDINKNYMYVLNQDGVLVHSFPVEVKPNFIAVTPKENLVISPCEVGCAGIVDYNGNQKCKLTGPPELSTWCPTGVTCFSNGDILVANGQGEVGIYKYTKDGEYVGLVPGTRESVFTPWGITLSHDNKDLFVNDEHESMDFKL